MLKGGRGYPFSYYIDTAIHPICTDKFEQPGKNQSCTGSLSYLSSNSRVSLALVERTRAALYLLTPGSTLVRIVPELVEIAGRDPISTRSGTTLTRELLGGASYKTPGVSGPKMEAVPAWKPYHEL